MKIKNKSKYILISSVLGGLIFPLVSNAGWVDDVFKAISLSALIPSGACIRSIDGSVEGSTQSAEDLRGITPEIFGISPGDILGDSLSLQRCSAPQVCNETGSGSITGRLDNETDYDLFIVWGECDEEGGGGAIGGLRESLNSIRSIFPARLSSERGIIGTIGRVIRWTLGISGAILLIMVIYAGALYLTAGGNEKAVDKAKNTLTWSVIGIVIIFGAWLIADFVVSALTKGA